MRLGALVTMADAADAPAVQARFPVVAQALLAGASPQLRNMATLGGNVMQRTRCAYFRDVSQPCNKRLARPGLRGDRRPEPHACGDRHESRTASARIRRTLPLRCSTVDANVRMRGVARQPHHPHRRLPRPPRPDTPNIETVLDRGDLIEAIELPASALRAHVRRTSRFATARRMNSRWFRSPLRSTSFDGTIRTARVALGGVAPVPWRSRAAEAALVGQPSDCRNVRGGRTRGDRRHARLRQERLQNRVGAAHGRIARCERRRAAYERQRRSRLIGPPRERVDGRLKVTGARPIPPNGAQTNLAYGFPGAQHDRRGPHRANRHRCGTRAPSGVIAVMTPDNAPRVNRTRRRRQRPLSHGACRTHKSATTANPLPSSSRRPFEAAKYRRRRLVSVDVSHGRADACARPRRAVPLPSRKFTTSPRTRSRGAMPGPALAQVGAAHRQRVHDAAGKPQSDGAARHDRDLGRRPAHRLRCQPRRSPRAQAPVLHVRRAAGRTFTCHQIRRRSVRVQRLAVAAHDPRGDGRETDRPAGADRTLAAANVGVDRLSAGRPCSASHSAPDATAG